MLKKLRNKLPRRLRNSKIWDKQSQESQQRLEFDKQLILNKSRKKSIPSLKQLKYISSFFSARERLTITSAFLGIIIAVGFAIFFAQAAFLKPAPKAGGSYREALVGNPLYINPILAGTNDVDLDLTKLMFAGLLRYDNNLKLQPDLAESYEISEDGRVYQVILRDNIFWHDDVPITAEDVIFTFKTTQEPAVNSPLQLSLQDVLIEKIDEKTITFSLEKPFTPFASILTTGIIPSHIWAGIPANNIRLAERNIKPIGSGAWKFDKLEKDKQGNIHTYTLIPFEKYHFKKPYLQELSFRFYPDFKAATEALNNQKVEGISFVPSQLINSLAHAQNFDIHNLQLPQYTSIFFNQEQNSMLEDTFMKKILAYSIDRDRLIAEALDGLGQIANGPLLPGMSGYDPTLQGFPYNPIEAQALLDEAGWESITAEDYIAFEKERIISEREAAEEDAEEGAEEEDDDNPPAEKIEIDVEIDTGNQVVFRKKDSSILEITLTTVDQPENIRAAEIISNAWRTIGIKVDLEIVPVNTLLSDTLPSKNYQALLYSQILNVFPDLYTFWHSSQIDYPGLNLANFADKDADELLEKARETTNIDEQSQLYVDFQKILEEELPAIFLFSPKYTYLIPVKIKGFEVDRINIPADRWNNINDWYVKTKRQLRR